MNEKILVICRRKTITLLSRSNEMSMYVAATAQDKKIRRRIFLGTKIQQKRHDKEIKSTIKQQTDETTTNLIQSN